MKKQIFVFSVIACAMFVYAQNVFAYENVNQGCTTCHSSNAVHSVFSHTACINCHSSPSGGSGNVAPAKCAVCHPAGNPGACNLVVKHSTGNCMTCHGNADVVTQVCSTSNCAAAQVLGEDDPGLVTLRQFRDKILAKSSFGKRIINIYYNNEVAVSAALKKNPTLKAFSSKALQSFIYVAEIFM